MTEKNEKVKFQLYVDKDLAEKVDYLAGRLNMKRSDFLATLVEFGVADNKRIIEFVTSKFMKPVRSVLAEFERKLKRKE